MVPRKMIFWLISSLRLTLIFCSSFYLAFTLTDIAVLGYGRDAFKLFLGRLTVALTRLGATTAEVVGMSVFMLIAMHRPGELPWHAMSMAIMLVVVYLFIPNRLVYALVVALCSTGAFIALAFSMGRLAPSDMLTMSMLLVLTNTFSFVAARRYHRLWRMEFRAQSILRNLSERPPHGLLQPALRWRRACWSNSAYRQPRPLSAFAKRARGQSRPTSSGPMS